jgi:hypothetical protein
VIDYFEHAVKLYVIPNLWCLMFGNGVVRVGANDFFFGKATITSKFNIHIVQCEPSLIL